MAVEMLVINEPPELATVRPDLRDLLEVFQKLLGPGTLPYIHQAKVWEQHLRGEETLLVAGTASGKTLAMAVPLLAKLFSEAPKPTSGCAIWLYPTIALLEDQERVLSAVFRAMGRNPDQSIGHLQGGMSRSELIRNLNRPVILATPDEVYWFFHKNVKYSSVLIYGLALVDDFVLDEAHLFSGLMLRNLSLLKRRVELLAAKLGRHPRWHLLTATPTRALRELTSGIEVIGRSRSAAVRVSFLPPVATYVDRTRTLVKAVDHAIENGAHKVLLVCNSADLAHRIFENSRNKPAPSLPTDVTWRFGSVLWKDLHAQLVRKQASQVLSGAIESWLSRRGPFFPKDLAPGAQIEVPADTAARLVCRLLESQTRILGPGSQPPKSRMARLVLEAATAVGLTDQLQTWLAGVQDQLEAVSPEGGLVVTAPHFQEITNWLERASIPPGLSSALTEYLAGSVRIPDTDSKAALSPDALRKRYVPLRCVGSIAGDLHLREEITRLVQEAITGGGLNVDTRHIAAWGDPAVPSVIYTGKMAPADRAGLIEAFDSLPRAVLISTSAVEVGVDFRADHLVTEECDGNAWLQRFGRVGREGSGAAEVVTLMHDGQRYVRLFQAQRPQITREELGQLIADPNDGVFPVDVHAEDSELVDAAHWIVNEQLGRVGAELNAGMFHEGIPARLGRQLRAAGLSVPYGLRSTLPGVELQSGVRAEPFYVLKKVSNERLASTQSPFELAYADMDYLEFLGKRAYCQVLVDIPATLQRSQAMFWRDEDGWHIRACGGIASDYASLFSSAISPHLHPLAAQVHTDLSGLLERLRRATANPKVRPILAVGEALPLFFAPAGRFILGRGDVLLSRVYGDGVVEPVEDRWGRTLALPDQCWLVDLRNASPNLDHLLRTTSTGGLDELLYQLPDGSTPGDHRAILLDRVVGGCFHIYQRLVDYVGR